MLSQDILPPPENCSARGGNSADAKSDVCVGNSPMPFRRYNANSRPAICIEQKRARGVTTSSFPSSCSSSSLNAAVIKSRRSLSDPNGEIFEMSGECKDGVYTGLDIWKSRWAHNSCKQGSRYILVRSRPGHWRDLIEHCEAYIHCSKCKLVFCTGWEAEISIRYEQHLNKLERSD